LLNDVSLGALQEIRSYNSVNKGIELVMKALMLIMGEKEDWITARLKIK